MIAEDLRTAACHNRTNCPPSAPSPDILENSGSSTPAAAPAVLSHQSTSEGTRRGRKYCRLSMPKDSRGGRPRPRPRASSRDPPLRTTAA